VPQNSIPSPFRESNVIFSKVIGSDISPAKSWYKSIWFASGGIAMNGFVEEAPVDATSDHSAAVVACSFALASYVLVMSKTWLMDHLR
jgi:hypothetical protein